MGQVISLLEKQERWREVYASPQGELTITCSSSGRMSLDLKGGKTTLSFVDAVIMIDSVEKFFGIKV